MRRCLPLVAVALFSFAVASAFGGSGPIQIESKKKDVVAAGEAGGTARCDKKEKALGGGFKSAPGQALAQVYPQQSRPAGNGWRVGVHNQSFSESRRFTVFAICQKRPGALTKETAVTEVKPPDDYTATARCEDGDPVVGGGFRILDGGPGFNGTVHDSLPIGFAGRADAWKVTIDSIYPIRLKAYAICRKSGPRISLMESRTIFVDPSSSESTVIDCPDKAPDMLGGGFSAGGVIPVASRPASDDSWAVTVVNPGAGVQGSFEAYVLCQGRPAQRRPGLAIARASPAPRSRARPRGRSARA